MKNDYLNENIFSAIKTFSINELSKTEFSRFVFFFKSQFLEGAAIVFPRPGHQKKELRHCPHRVGTVQPNKFRPRTTTSTALR